MPRPRGTAGIMPIPWPGIQAARQRREGSPTQRGNLRMVHRRTLTEWAGGFLPAHSLTQTTKSHKGVIMTKQQLAEEYAQSLANTIWENDYEGNVFGLDDEGNQIEGYQWLEDALDIEYVVDGENRLKGAMILIGYGGPNVWVDTRWKNLIVAWDEVVTKPLPPEFCDILNFWLDDLRQN